MNHLLSPIPLIFPSHRYYFGIGVVHGKTLVNLGTLWRSAFNFDAAFMVVVGPRYKPQSSDTVKAYRHIPLYRYISVEDFLEHRPYDCPLVAVELTEAADSLVSFVHPKRAIYLLGPEDGSLPQKVLDAAQAVVRIPSLACLNQAVAGSIVMFDRVAKQASGRS